MKPFVMKPFVAGVVLVAGLLGTASADHNPCNRNPACNQGVGGIAGYACVRSEVNTIGDQGNGRICTGGDLETTIYVYARGLGNRQPLIVCRDFEQVFPERDPNAPDFCAPAH